MYQLGRRSHHHKLLLLGAGLLVLGGLTFVTAKLLRLSSSTDSHITNSPPVVKNYDPAGTATVHVDAPLFSLDLPGGWRYVGRTHDTYQGYSYQSSKPGTQLLTVYIDSLPQTLAVNRVLSVQAQGDQIGHDTVSDNCVNFLPTSSLASPQAKSQGVVDAKWQGVEFYCDTGNYERDVVGTSSPDGINRVVLSGASSGQHSLFFTYTDNAVSPDFTGFYSILDSFKLK